MADDPQSRFEVDQHLDPVLLAMGAVAVVAVVMVVLLILAPPIGATGCSLLP